MDSVFEPVIGRLGGNAPRRIDEPGALEAAVALILVPTAGSGFELLLIQRAKRAGDPWSGQMGLPGGRREDGDGELLNTARRETREETGIELAADSLLGELDDLFTNIKVLPKIVVRPFVFGLGSRPKVTPGEELAAYQWTSLDTLRASQRRTEVVVAGERREVDAFLLGEDIVWGITYRILVPFLGVGR